MNVPNQISIHKKNPNPTQPNPLTSLIRIRDVVNNNNKKIRVTHGLIFAHWSC